MNKFTLAAALATIAFPSIAFAAPAAPMAPMPAKDGCCPEKKDGEKPDDCCKGMKCCAGTKASEHGAATDAHGAHVVTH
jgi:hypothetical protein